MKREYIKPVMMREVFAANEYIAACGDNGVSYYFKCNAGEKGKHYDVYQTTEAGQTSGGTLLTTDFLPGDGYFYPCDEDHTTNGMNDFKFGYIKDNGGFDWVDGTRTAVIIWKGLENDNIHCTADLDISKWETAKS